MAANGINVNMTPSHPGDFIRSEIIEEFGLNVTKAAKILGVRRATLSALVELATRHYRRRWPSHREGFRREHGHAIEDAGVVRRCQDACSCR